MNGRPLTDTQISQALRLHLPERAQAGLRERVLEATEASAQLRALPSFFGALSDADPVGRRRSLLIAAALLLAVAVASAAAVGAWRLFQRAPLDPLSLEPPADVPAFVLSSYERLPQLPPLAFTWRGSDSAKGRVYVDRSGTVRFDRFASADATEPASYRILSPDHRVSGVATVGSDKVWIEQGHEAIGEDPRVFLRTVLRGGGDAPGCEMERDASEVGNGTAATGWRYVGLEYVVGRATHHVTCGGGDLWIDIETRLILRTQGPAVDDAGQPVPVEVTEVTEIAFAEQPAALFVSPGDLARISEEEYVAYVCARNLPNELAPGISDCPTTDQAEAPPPAEPSPTPTVGPDASDCGVPSSDPSERIGPLAWTPERRKSDWPAPVRPEPAGGRSVQPIPLTYRDPTGDDGSGRYPCVDIRWVMADTSEVHLKLVSNPPEEVDPTAQWIAYGVVTDDDRDGVPDWRYGVDRTAANAAEDWVRLRGWRTNLHTGQTEAGPYEGDPPWGRLGGGFQALIPSERAGSEREASFRFGGSLETTQGSEGWGFQLGMPFYTWASVIVNGRVVATDYAPDAGWLVATRGVPRGGTFLLGDPFPDLSMTVPEGWTRSSDANELRRVTCGDRAPHTMADGAYAEDCALVRFEMIDSPEERCDGTTRPNHGSSFDDFVTYVAGQAAARSVTADVTVDGYRGKHLEYSSVNEPQVEDFCRFAYYRQYGYRDAGSVHDFWFVDVDGVILMIGSARGGALEPNVPEHVVKAEIRRMVESIQFER
jgi:hypothetical protein